MCLFAIFGLVLALYAILWLLSATGGSIHEGIDSKQYPDQH